ncbi:bcl-2-like protein 2 isoform X2 [Marmota monax]|uniref:bcl-2-like protein 2 isoform X2 n=1 Tax=Marmota monax TaxID=9995 RepID=UPI0026ECD11B|nr:bcl-2-like protein 2 isoform X2 [Marmota monax]
MATPASAPDTRALVADFVGYKLRQKGYVCGAGPGEGPAADPLHQAMRAAGDEFETRFRRTFSDLAAQLHVTPGSAQQRFTQVSDELFQGGPNWGRLVAFFVFGAALCAESVNKEMEPLVGQVQEWMVAYLETRLADWIHSSGGWVVLRIEPSSSHMLGKHSTIEPQLQPSNILFNVFVSLIK